MEILGTLLVVVSGYLLWRLYRVEGDLKNLTKRFDLLVSKLQENASSAQVTQDQAASEEGEPAQGTAAQREAVPETIVDEAALKATGPWANVDAETKAAPPPEMFGPPPPPPPPPEPGLLEKLGPWIVQNWFYLVSALSLALAGIFLVQYGMENGLLPPRARVFAALLFGATLIGAGELIRRRFGDHEDATTAYLPSVFSGAGIVTLFGSILSARLLYDLIGPEAALFGMIAVALVAMVLGWFYGPLLAAVGLLGAYTAPYVVGGESEDASWLFGYFAVLAVMGLGIDTIKRWTWVSVLTLVLAYATGALLGVMDEDVALAFVLYLTALPLLAMTIPQRALVPNHDGHMISDLLWLKDGLRIPYIPVQLLGGAMLASVMLMQAIYPGDAEFWLVLVCLLVLTLAITLWGRGASAIQDIAILPVAALLILLVNVAIAFGTPVFRNFRDAYVETPEADFPFAVTLFLVIGAALSLLAAWRSQEDGRLRLPFSYAAILIAPVIGIVLEMFWTPAEVLGAPVWAAHALALAALMVWFAASFAKRDGGPGLRTALAVLAALSIIAYGLSLVLTLAALTVGLAVMIAVAAWLDRQFKLPQMSWFVVAGVAVVGYRLLADPGLEWGIEEANLFEVLLSYGGALAASLAAWVILKPMERTNTKAVLEAGAMFFGALLICILLFRAIDEMTSGDPISHWAFGLYATVWLTASLAQLYSMKNGEGLKALRIVAAVAFGLVGFGALLLAVTVFNPLAAGNYFSSRVEGPIFVNTLIPAYLFPAVVFGLGALWITHMPRWLRGTWLVMAGGLAIMWGFAVIRHFWSETGEIGANVPMSQPELYTYTVVLLVTGAGLFYQSLAKSSDFMRRAGLVVIGLAVAKVFLIDISGLQGLTRVFSLLILGLSLAALAWLNRWAQTRGEDAPQQALDPEE